MTVRTSVQEVTRLIRKARTHWDAHENGACRRERDRALKLYEALTPDERQAIPETHRTWLRYRSEKYFGSHRTAPGTKHNQAKPPSTSAAPRKNKKIHAPAHAIAWCRVPSPVGHLVILASKKGIAGLFFNHRIEPTTLPREHPENRHLAKAAKQLDQYFLKKRTEFDLPLDAKGSAFQRAVWRELSRIPYGVTIGYAELARRIDNPKAVRAVGTANGANPVSIIVPCHRVIGSDGSLTGFGGGLDVKKKLLEHEGLLLPGI